MMAIRYSVVSLGFVCLLLFGCGQSKSKPKLIETGPLAGLPQAGKVVSDSSGIWRVHYFKNDFKEPTEHPLITTCKLPFECQDMDNKPLSSACDSIVLQIYVNDSHIRVRIFGSYITDCFYNNLIPVRFNTKEGDGTIFKVERLRYESSTNDDHRLFFDDKASLEIIQTLLSANGPVCAQLKRDKGSYYWQQKEALYSFTLETEGIHEVYNQFVRSELKWEAECKNNSNIK